MDLSWGFAGAVVGMFLADYGAEVVRVEPPGGDAVRRHPAFPMWHRGKKSVVLDLKRPGGLANAQKLAAGADVVLITCRPGVAERLGLDYASLSRRNPGLVHASITAFGTRGPFARLKGYEGIVLAKMGGYGHSSDMAPRQGPAFAAVPWASFSASQTALHGILAALYVRQRTGAGQKVETSLVQGMLSQDPWNQILDYLAEKYPEAYQLTPPVPKEGAPFTDYMFRLLVAMTGDGRWLQFSQTSPHLWKALVKALDLEWVYGEPRFKNAPAMETFEDSVEFWNIMLETVRSRTFAEWEEHFRQHPDVGAELYRTAEEGLEHPQMAHNQHLMELDDPRVGRTLQLAPMVRLLDSPATPRRPAPELGQHTRPVLRAVASGAWKPSLPPGRAPLPKHPLDGVTIVELGLFYASPYGTTLLADLGARVIKLEPPRGDDIRYAMPIPETGAVKVLQGKESVAVDLERPEGQEIAHRIIARADMVMMSFRGGVAQRLRMDCQTLRRLNPRLVYLNAPGYGVDGPYARKPAYAPTIGAAVGSALTQAGPGAIPGEPAGLTLDQIKAVSVRLRSAASGPGNADGVASQGVGTALLLGLLARERTGVAHEMLTSMLCTTAYANSAGMVRYQGKPSAGAPDPMLYGLHALYRLYQAAEGWVFLACLQEDEWQALARAVAAAGGPDLAKDPGLATPELRRRNDAALATALEQALSKRSASQWEALFAEHDVACVEVAPGPLFRFANKSPVMVENGFVTEVDHPTFGHHPRLAPLVEFSRTPGVARPGVTIGQHTRAVLAEFGYGAHAMARLEAARVIRCG